MKKLFTLICAIVGITSLSAQNPTNSGNLAEGFKIMRSGAEGTPYLSEDWYIGYGIFKDGTTSRPQQMNYDIHGNNLVYKTAGNDNVMKLMDNSFQGFILKNGDEEMLFAKIDGNAFDKEKDDEKYYQIVKAPSRNVIIQYEKKLDDPNASGWMSSKDNTLNAEYKMDIEYYVMNKDGKYEEVKLKNNSVLKVFKDKKSKLSSYMVSNNIDIDTAEDLSKVVDYYHSI
ncbi:hypothetical protein [Gramella sp. AN32]|uniref:Uncharacterized protein n=1 Tax=Christiangramia antarctica TaxID=2058158 RepID=A0ABW5X4G0_9FLAO|nr:hypothetical protein [Gramella sp. AN32]MCM4157510.1 hypothetical protein [Gramella sp. AN32]